MPRRLEQEINVAAVMVCIIISGAPDGAIKIMGQVDWVKTGKGGSGE